MLLEILPQHLMVADNIQVVMKSDLATVLHKRLETSLLDTEMYLSRAAFLFVLSGEQNIMDYDGKRRLVKAGELLYLARDMYLVSDFVPRKGAFEALVFFFDDAFFLNSSSIAMQKEDGRNSIPLLPHSLQLIHYMQSLTQTYLDANFSDTLVSVKMTELIELIMLQRGGEQFLGQIHASGDQGKKRDIADFMEQNCFKNLRIEDYAALTGRSRSTFIRDFKKHYGNTPNRWLIHRRLEKAHSLLLASRLNVTDVAMEVGYDNVSHFIEAYKKKYRITPKQTQSTRMTLNP